MAKRTRRKRRSFNLRPVRIQSSLSIGALASADVISGAVTNNASNPMRLVSAHLSFGISDLAALIDDGFMFGIAHGDYTAAEIEECLEAGGTMDQGDKIALEAANRLVREIGIITKSTGGTIGSGLSFNDGRPVKIRLNWKLSIGKAFQVWVRNNSGTIYTAGSLLQVGGKLWVRDGF